MVSVKGRDITDVPLEIVAGKLRLVTPDNDLILQGKRIGISFGIAD
jgi:6-phosphofructokinase 1